MIYIKQLQLFFILIFSALLSKSCEAQLLTYQIYMGSDSIGLMHAEHRFSGTHNYELKSNMTVNSVVTVEIQYILTASFDKDKLLNSFTEQAVNGRIKVSSTVKWDGKNYNVQTLNKRDKIKNTTITYDLATLYFKEPVNLRKIYSDTHGSFLTIKPIEPHKYELILPDGKRNIYSYQFGICKEVEINQLFSKVFFKLVKN
jgi:hypothetical protein